jgi:methionine-rich copper-binding protein CopC
MHVHHCAARRATPGHPTRSRRPAAATATAARAPGPRPAILGRGAARRLAGLLALCALAVTGALGSAITFAAPASAHAALVKATPADGARLSSAPSQVVLQFDDPISTSFATLVVTGPDGHDVTTGKPTVSGSTVTGELEGGLASGAYRTAFRVVSDDGHPVSGQLRFTLQLPATASPSASSSAGPGTPSAQPSPTSGASTPAGPTETGQPVVPGSAPVVSSGSAAEGSSWFAANLLPLSGVLVLVVIGAGALLWDRQRH